MKIMPSQDSSQPRLDSSQPSPEVEQKIKELMTLIGADPQSQEADLVGQIIYTSLRMVKEDFDMGQLKLMTRSFKEMRHAYHVFNKHQTGRCVSIFGSARTPELDPDYQAAKAFSAAIAAKGWVCMTGAADGIMRAGLEGAPKNSSFGLSIRLPFENTNHTLLVDDPKLINFRYFFTRKLMFLSHSDAIAAFPGGVGTQDELFESLTLMQTGRSNIVPLVLLEGGLSNYWEAWEHYIQNHLLANGFINAEDQYLYYRAPGVQEAVNHILQFYHRYHSSRYVKDTLVIRLLAPLTLRQIAFLNDEFKPLIKQGSIYATSALAEEDDHLDLPRIAFEHNHKFFGLLRAMIDRINAF
jgi:uncharacterized protein (TIGR00730 family)